MTASKKTTKTQPAKQLKDLAATKNPKGGAPQTQGLSTILKSVSDTQSTIQANMKD